MEQLIFFAILIAFSILEAAARKKKAAEQRQRAKDGADRLQGPGAPSELPEWRSQPEPTYDLPTYDDEPSYDVGRSRDQAPAYDDLPTYDDEPSYDERVAPRPSERGQPMESRRQVETLADLFGEIAGLAREQQSGRERPVPSPRVQPGPSRKIAPRKRPPPTPVEEHPVHRAHAGYGTDPSERARSEQDGLDPLAERLNETARSVRAELRAGGSASLRQAVILKEVLGLPLALRDDT